MELSLLSAISPLDGRYRGKVADLAPYFSEYALIRYRVLLEVEYFIALHQTGVSPLSPLSNEKQKKLRSLYTTFSEEDAAEIKATEKITNHDVKAVEYFVKKQIESIGDPDMIAHKEFVHFGLTSQDVNNTAIPMMLRDGIQAVFLPKLKEIMSFLAEKAGEWKHISMLARTHGQAASPTTLGKEIGVFHARLKKEVDVLACLPYPAKFGGATGNMNAHYLAYPHTDWHAFADTFVNGTLNVTRSFPTTQIEHYDGLSRLFDCIKRINTILMDLCQDAWLYISMEYFRQKIKKGEVGSSAMPHKVNPIDFENGEGNCGISTALLEFLSRKLPVSRLQRDLTDSTILRNVGTAIGHAYLAQTSILRGLNKLIVNPDAIQTDLDQNWAVLAEAIQTILRREGYPNPYEALRDFTRGNTQINADTLFAFVETLDVGESIKKELQQLRPETYIGK